MYKIEITHSCGHITTANIDLSQFECLNSFEKVGAMKEYLNEILKPVWAQITQGSQISLIIKSRIQK